MKNIIKYGVLSAVLLVLSFTGCSDSETNKGYFQERTFKIMDGITEKARGEENVKLTFYDNNGEVASSVRRTGEGGTFTFKGSVNGKYIAEFSYFGSSSYDNEIEFTVKKENEVVMTVMPPDAKPLSSPVVITGLMIDPAGWDQGKTGSNITWEPNTIVYQHDGSYEYVQFLALEDIDFSITPYSVVVVNSGPSSTPATLGVRSVSVDGWAQGGNVTYKFDLTSGSVDKGGFFYVGGDAKRIGGFVKTCSYFSEKIDHANWIRTMNYPSFDGDGFGNKTKLGLFDDANSPSVGNNIADGVAIFFGTNVTEASVPLDAIFYGSKMDKNVYDGDNSWGYRVPENEFYSAEHPETGAAQPLFGQGSNTHLFRDVTSEYNTTEYLMLGGVFAPGVRYSSRGATYKIIAPCPGAASLDDIEKGSGVSYILEAGN